LKLREVLEDFDRLLGTDQVVEGILMEAARSPYIGFSATDWGSTNCIHLPDDGLFDLLLDTIFPHTIGGGKTKFKYPAVALGRLVLNEDTRAREMRGLRWIRINIHAEEFTLSLS
jgi:hypothetical protein